MACVSNIDALSIELQAGPWISIRLNSQATKSSSLSFIVLSLRTWIIDSFFSPAIFLNASLGTSLFVRLFHCSTSAAIVLIGLLGSIFAIWSCCLFSWRIDLLYWLGLINYIPNFTYQRVLP